MLIYQNISFTSNVVKNSSKDNPASLIIALNVLSAISL